MTLGRASTAMTGSRWWATSATRCSPLTSYIHRHLHVVAAQKQRRHCRLWRGRRLRCGCCTAQTAKQRAHWSSYVARPPPTRETHRQTERETGRDANRQRQLQRCRGCPSGPGIAELLQPHSIELGWRSGADCSRFISALRQRHRERKRRLGSPQQLMALSAQMGKSTGEVVGERERERNK
jgi:hypothetical protein